MVFDGFLGGPNQVFESLLMCYSRSKHNLIFFSSNGSMSSQLGNFSPGLINAAKLFHPTKGAVSKSFVSRHLVLPKQVLPMVKVEAF